MICLKIACKQVLQHKIIDNIQQFLTVAYNITTCQSYWSAEMNDLIAQIKSCQACSLFTIIKKVIPLLKKYRWQKANNDKDKQKRKCIMTTLVDKIKSLGKECIGLSNLEYFKYCLKKLNFEADESAMMSQLDDNNKQINKYHEDQHTNIVPKINQILCNSSCPACAHYYIKNLPFYSAQQNGHCAPLFVRDFKSLYQQQLCNMMCAIGNQGKGTIIITKSHMNITPKSGFQKFPKPDQKNLYTMLQNSLNSISHNEQCLLKLKVDKVKLITGNEQQKQKQQQQKQKQKAKAKQNQKKSEKPKFTSKFASKSTKQKSKLLKYEEFAIRIVVQASNRKDNRIFYKEQIFKNTNKVVNDIYGFKDGDGKVCVGGIGVQRKFGRLEGEDIYEKMVKMANKQSKNSIKGHNCSFFQSQKDEISFCMTSFPHFEKMGKQKIKEKPKKPCNEIVLKEVANKQPVHDAFPMIFPGSKLPDTNYSYSKVTENTDVVKFSTQDCKVIESHPFSSTYTCVKVADANNSNGSSTSLVPVDPSKPNQNEPKIYIQNKLNDVFTKCTIKKVGNGYLQTKSVLESEFKWVQTQNTTDCVMSYKEVTEVQYYSNAYEKKTMPKFQYSNTDVIKYL